MKLANLFGPQRHVHQFADAVATAGTELEEVCFLAPFNIKIDAVYIVPTTAIADDATDYVGVAVKNKGTAGTGTTVVASRDFDAADGSDDVAACTDAALTLSSTAANLLVDAGETLTAAVTKGGSGESLDGILVIEYHGCGG